MSSINLTRLASGILILVGMFFFKPLVYFVAIMLIVAAFTGFCLMEKLFNKIGIRTSCSLKK